jgi:hypothetical protein
MSNGKDYPTATTTEVEIRDPRRIWWGAVFAGTLVAFMVSLVLGILGMGIGLSTIHPTEEQNPFSGLGIGAAIWWVVSTLVALFIGGWVSARLAGVIRRPDAILHGILTWSVVTIATMLLAATTLGGLIGGATSIIGKGVSTAAQGAAPALSGVIQGAGSSSEGGGVLQDIQRTLPRLKEDPQAAQRLSQSLAQIYREGSASPENRETVRQIVNQFSDDPQQANQIADQLVSTASTGKQKVAQTEQKVREVGQKAAHGLSKAALWAFVALLLGAAAGAFGGRAGYSRYDDTVRLHAT